MRASSNPSLNHCNQNAKENDQEENKILRTRIDPLCTPSRARKSGAEILASALALAKAASGDSCEFLNSKDEVKNLSNVGSMSVNKTDGTKVTPASTFSGSHDKTIPVKLETMYELESIQLIKDFKINQDEDKSRENILVVKDGKKKDLPKINLNDRSEDEYGLSDGSSEDYVEHSKPPTLTKPKVKKSGEGKRLRAVKDKVNISTISLQHFDFFGFLNYPRHCAYIFNFSSIYLKLYLTKQNGN